MERTELAKEAKNIAFQDDEIDLKELVLALWSSKFLIAGVTIVCAVIAIAYALLAKQVWTTEAVVTSPQIRDFSDYQQMVNDFQPVFDVYQDSGSVLVSHKLDSFVLPETLFNIYIQQFESRANKKAYISTIPEFQRELGLLQSEEKNSDSDYQDRELRLYNDWYGKLVVSSIKSGSQDVNSYTLKGLLGSSVDSYEFLNGYIEFVAEKSRSIAIANLSSTVASKRSELLQQQMMLTEQAKGRLLNEQARSQYALEIAAAAGIDKPQQNLDGEELFAINIGANALAAKVKVLNNLTQLSIVEPRLHQLNSKLDLLNTLKVSSSVKFDTFQFIESPERPTSRTSPKRPLIAILGALLGGMLGCAIVLIRYAFKK
jgi:chain length determinant protein (polysaccharide antigen chain regulator)